MLTGFEEQTHPLAQQEKEFVDIFVKALAACVGKQNAITNPEMCKRVNEAYKVKFTEPRIRKIINHIRIHSLLPGLIASSNGYWVSDNIKEVEQHIQTLRGREASIAKCRQEEEKYLSFLQAKKNNFASS